MSVIITTILDALSRSPVTQWIGWSLIHFLWQAAIVAGALAIVLLVLRRRSAAWRYRCACAAMALMALMPLATLAFLSRNAWTGSPTQFAARPPMAEVASDHVVATELPPAMPPPAAQADVDETIITKIDRANPRLVGAWIIGVLALSLLHAGGWLRAQQFKRCAVRAPEPRYVQMLDAICVKLRIKRAVRLLESTLVRVPMVVGFLRPVVLLPVAAISGLTPSQLEAILAHELAHVRRNDYLINLLQIVVETLLFYHPAVWWISRRIRVEREHCCDDLAMTLCPDRYVYAEALTAVAELSYANATPALAATGGGPLLRRIQRILKIDANPKPHRTRSLAATMTVLAIVMSLLTFAPADTEPPASLPNNDDSAHSDSESATSTNEKTIQDLEDLVRKNSAEIEAKTRELRTLAQQFGMDDLGPLFEAQLAEMVNMERMYTKASVARTLAEEKSRGNDGKNPDLEDLKAKEQTLRKIFETQQVKMKEIGASHLKIKQLKEDIDKLKKENDEYKDKIKRYQVAEPRSAPSEPALSRTDNPERKLVPGDILIVTIDDVLRSHSKLTDIRRVADDGTIRVALIGAVRASGLTLDEVRQRINDEFVKQNFVVQPNASVKLRPRRGEGAPVADHRLAPGDQIVVKIADYGAPGYDHVQVCTVTESGHIVIPPLPGILAKGVTTHELETTLAKAIEESHLLQRAVVRINLLSDEPLIAPASSNDKPISEQPTTQAASRFQIRRVADENDADAPVDELIDPDDPQGQRKRRVLREVLLDETAIKSVEVRKGPQGNEIHIELTKAGGETFWQVTGDNIGRRLAIISRGRILSVATVQSQIRNSVSLVKKNGYTEAEAFDIVQMIERKNFPLLQTRPESRPTTAPGADAAGSQQDARTMTPEQIAERDPIMAKLLSRRDDYQMQIVQLRLKGIREDHRVMQNARINLKLTEDQIQRRTEEFRNKYREPQARQPPELAPPAPSPGPRIERIATIEGTGEGGSMAQPVPQ